MKILILYFIQIECISNPMSLFIILGVTNIKYFVVVHGFVVSKNLKTFVRNSGT